MPTGTAGILRFIGVGRDFDAASADYFVVLILLEPTLSNQKKGEGGLVKRMGTARSSANIACFARLAQFLIFQLWTQPTAAARAAWCGRCCIVHFFRHEFPLKLQRGTGIPFELHPHLWGQNTWNQCGILFAVVEGLKLLVLTAAPQSGAVPCLRHQAPWFRGIC